MKLYFGNTVTTITTVMVLALLGFIGYSVWSRASILYWGVPDPFGRDCNTDCQNAADAPVLVLSDVRRHRFKNCRDGSCAVPAPLNIELYLKGKRTASIIPNLLFLI